MQKKICPVCERPLTGSGYCRLCKKLVFKPLIRDVDYYLNELRPGHETTANERNGGRAQAALKVPEKDFGEKAADLYKDATKKSEKTNRKKNVSKVSGSQETVWNESWQKISASKKDSRKSRSKIVPVAAFLIIFGVAVQFIPWIVHFMSDSSAHRVQEYPENGAWEWEAEVQEEANWDSGEITIEEDTGSLEWEELDEKEIKAAGIRCSGEDHFSIHFIDVENLVKEEAYALGLETHMSLDSYNNRYDEGGEIREFYDTYRTYAMWDENAELELAVTVSSDTATGEVHFIAVNSHNEGSNQAAVQMMTALADLAAGQEGTLTENELSNALNFLEYVEKPEYNYYIYADIYIGEDSAYSLHIGPLHNWDEEEGNTV